MDEITPDPAETQHLLDQIRAGDPGAFDRLFARHRLDLCELVELRLDPRLRPRVDASDIVQEAQMEAVRRLDRYLEKPPMPFRLWLRQIAYDRLLMARRRHAGAARRTVHRQIAWPDRSSMLLMQRLEAAGSTPSQTLSRREIVQRVRFALGQLMELDREILLMRNFEGLSYAEISCLLEIDNATARKRYGRALLRLRTLLVEAGLWEPPL
jgi:RNA polymerase sigma-70 factor (ECF subfamily)